MSSFRNIANVYRNSNIQSSQLWDSTFDLLWSAWSQMHRACNTFIPQRLSCNPLRGSVLAFLTLFCLTMLTRAACAQSTVTTLVLSSGGTSVNTISSGSILTLTATVTSNNSPLTAGQVQFCDATASYCTDIHLVGTAQITSAGTATFKFLPGVGSHQYKAVFVGTTNYSVSSSTALSLTVTGLSPTTTTISQSGSAGNYTLNTAVSGTGAGAPTGQVSFLDTSNNNSALGTATLVSDTAELGFVNTSNPVMTVAYYPDSFVLADFNDDGIPDMVQASGSVLLGNGDGTFTAASKAIPVSGAAIAVGDFNRDGKLDLVVASDYPQSSGHNITALLGNGDGTFAAAASLLVAGDITRASIAVADFNGDGILDLAITNQADNSLTVLLGNGDGTFTATSANPQTGTYPYSVTVADFDGDGFPDLAVANRSDDTVTVLLNKGDATFTRSSIALRTGSTPESVVAGDFNQDGIPDLAVANFSDNSISVLIGNGDGTFTATGASPVSTGVEPTAIAIGDFNDDGIPDLAVANCCNATYEPGSMNLLQGDGTGNFTSVATVTTDSGASYITSADLNHDGVADLVIAVSSAHGSNPTAMALVTESQQATASATSISVPVATGTHSVVASYAGDANYMASTSAATSLSAAQGTPGIQVTASPNPGVYGGSIELDATVTGSGLTPTGTITFYDSSNTIGSATLSSGMASYTTAALSAGTHSIAASYAGDANYTSGSSTVLNLTVNKAAAAVALTPSSIQITDEQNVIVSVSVSGGSGLLTPSGTVTLSSGSYSQDQALSKGLASFSIPAGSLSSGTNTLTAAYQGDAQYSASTATTSITVSQVVLSSSSPTPISPGASVTTNVALSAGSTYSGTMNLSCTLKSSPTGAKSLPTCSLDPASLALSAGGSGSATLTVKTTAATTSSAQLKPASRVPWRLASSGAFLAGLLFFGFPYSRRRSKWMLLLLLACAACGVTACGGGGGSTSTPPATTTPATTAGSYTFTVAGVDASNANITASTDVTITVQ